MSGWPSYFINREGGTIDWIFVKASNRFLCPSDNPRAQVAGNRKTQLIIIMHKHATRMYSTFRTFSDVILFDFELKHLLEC
mmetsp:Transcript_11999/g.23076  ORF Transcript_11999/g.23076 Transcript_11999/m.23076 type:complete len:81 (+) Transcript_11999:812-1054(+)